MKQRASHCECLSVVGQPQRLLSRGEPQSMPCLLKGGSRAKKEKKALEEEMNYLKICIEQIRQDSLLTSAVSSPLIFIGLCRSEINAESTVRCKPWRLLHKQDSAEQNEYFS